MPRLVEQKLIISGNIYEYYQYEKGYLKGYTEHKRGSSGRLGSGEITEEQQQENRSKVEHRAKQNIRRLINSNSDRLTKFLTLTYADNFTDVQESNLNFKKFIMRLNYYLKKNNKPKVEYIAVIEFQKRGAIHYHMLCNLTYVDAKTINEIWGHGNINIKRIDRVDNVGSYVTKYMDKDLDDERLHGEKSYLYSTGLKKPTEITNLGKIKELLTEEVLNHLVYDFASENDYTGKTNYYQYNLSRANTVGSSS